VNAKLNDIVSRAFEATWEAAQKRDVPMRVAAYGLACSGSLRPPLRVDLP